MEGLLSSLGEDGGGGSGGGQSLGDNNSFDDGGGGGGSLDESFDEARAMLGGLFQEVGVAPAATGGGLRGLRARRNQEQQPTGVNGGRDEKVGIVADETEDDPFRQSHQEHYHQKGSEGGDEDEDGHEVPMIRGANIVTHSPMLNPSPPRSPKPPSSTGPGSAGSAGSRGRRNPRHARHTTPTEAGGGRPNERVPRPPISRSSPTSAAHVGAPSPSTFESPAAAARRRGLGDLAKLPVAFLERVACTLFPRSLARLGCTSSLLRALVLDDEIWRRASVRRCGMMGMTPTVERYSGEEEDNNGDGVNFVATLPFFGGKVARSSSRERNCWWSASTRSKRSDA